MVRIRDGGDENQAEIIRKTVLKMLVNTGLFSLYVQTSGYIEESHSIHVEI